MRFRIGFLALCLAFFHASIAQSPIGVWKTIDDEDGEAMSHIEIYEDDGRLHGRIVHLLPAAEGDTCVDCPGEFKDKPLLGLTILWDLKPKKKKWVKGRILDPENGKVYKCKIELESADVLKIRGYVGVPMLGRTQSWFRVVADDEG